MAECDGPAVPVDGGGIDPEGVGGVAHDDVVHIGGVHAGRPDRVGEHVRQQASDVDGGESAARAADRRSPGRDHDRPAVVEVHLLQCGAQVSDDGVSNALRLFKEGGGRCVAAIADLPYLATSPEPQRRLAG